MSGSKPTKVPRASFGVTILDDPDYMLLISSVKDGRAAFAAFVALVLAAKLQKNGGTFREPIEVIAGMCRWPPQDFVKALDAIDAACKRNGNTSWVVRRQDRLIIRNFDRWNNSGWGGQRVGAGRPESSGNQEDNQADNQDDSSRGASVSVSVPDSDPDAQAQRKKDSCVGAAENPGEQDGSVGSAAANSALRPPDSFSRSDIAGVLGRDEPRIGPQEWAIAKPFVDEAWSELPAHAQRDSGRFQIAFVQAMRLGVEPERLVATLQAYYESPDGRGKYAMHAHNWLHGERYNDNPAAWQSRDNRGDDATGGDIERGKRVIAEARRQRELVDRERASQIASDRSPS